MNEIIICVKGKLKESDNEYYLRKSANSSAVCLNICQGVTEIESGFFDVFSNVYQVKIPASVTKMKVSDAALKILKKNNTILTGFFDSPADTFAKDNNLPFVHADIIIGYRQSEYSTDIVTLCFEADGKPYIYENSVSPGMSASSTGGGETRINLKKDFFKKYSQVDLAAECWGCCYSSIVENEKLKIFLQKAISRNGYTRGI